MLGYRFVSSNRLLLSAVGTSWHALASMALGRWNAVVPLPGCRLGPLRIPPYCRKSVRATTSMTPRKHIQGPASLNAHPPGHSHVPPKSIGKFSFGT